jgi:hypothetical protein
LVGGEHHGYAWWLPERPAREVAHPMSKLRAHGAFLVRYWRYNGEQCIEVEHLQSGASASLSAFAEVERWIEACSRSAAGEDIAEQADAAPRAHGFPSGPGAEGDPWSVVVPPVERGDHNA